MDFNSINTGYLNNAASNASQITAATQKAVDKDYTNASDDELLNACKQFEAYFIEQVMKETIKTVPTSDKSNQLVDYFKDMTIQELSSQVQEQSGLGLAQTMYEQLKRNYIGFEINEKYFIKTPFS